MTSRKSKGGDGLSEEKLQKGKQDVMDKAKEWKGGSHKERQESAKEKKREVQKRVARDQEEVSWKKKAGAIAAVVFMCGAGFAQFLSTILGAVQGTGIVNVDIADTAKLKSVLFSGEPWLVYCVNNDTATQRLPRVLEEGASTLSSSLGVSTAVIRCWDQSASGRSVAQRFKLNLKPPLAFVTANGNTPRTINLVGISKIDELEKRVKPALKVEAHKIDTLKKWPNLCTSRKTCVVIGHKNGAQRELGLNVFKPLLEKHRGVKVVTLDTAFWQLKLDEKVLRTRASGKGAQVFCLARDDAPGGNATYRGAFLQDLDGSSASTFMKACEARESLLELEKAPKINARPSKPKKAAPPPSPKPRPPSPKPKDPERGNVDRVGSRETLENEEPLFEAVDDDEEEDGEGEEEEEDEGEASGDEVEL
mmetsp:Transcript_45611/g.128407  ORF Transcript_45611/g.128407 Transcript_45611/m.128407 type:complete len:421 (+) Transcript_45611:91-1353(+)